MVMAVVIRFAYQAPLLQSRCLSTFGAAVTEFCRSGRSDRHSVSYLSSLVRISFCLGISHLLSETPNLGFFFKDSKRVLEGRKEDKEKGWSELGRPGIEVRPALNELS